MSDLIQQIEKIAGLQGHPDLAEAKTGNALLNEALEEFYPNDTVRLKHLRKALNTTAKVGWDVLIQAKPLQMVEICVSFLADNGDGEGEAPKKKKAPAKTKKGKAPKKAAPPEEEEETPPETEEPPPEKAPKKRRPVRRKTKAAEEPADEPADEQPEVPKEPKAAKKKTAKEVVADIPAIEKYIDKKFDHMEKALLDVASTGDVEQLREEMRSEHARTRSMLQQFYSAVYKMIADEDFVPPPELDED
jgi:hypothetical protein